MNKWISVDDIIAEQKKYCLLCEGEEEATHCNLCFARDIVSAIIHHTDGIDIVHCRECKKAHLTYDGECKYCDEWKDDDGNYIEVYHDGNHYCSYGCRKESEFCEAEPQPRCPKCGKRGYIRSLESMGVKLKHFDEYKWKCTNCNRYFKEEPKDEPQTERSACDTCQWYNSGIPCGVEPSVCKRAVEYEPQTEFPCDTCANKGDHNGECSNCVADSEPIRWKTPSHYKPKTKSQKAIKDLQEYYGIKQEPMLSEMV